MKKEDLKVGQSFVVVEVLDNVGYNDLKGKQGIAIERPVFDGFEFKQFSGCETDAAYLFNSEVKKIARLTITKLK